MRPYLKKTQHQKRAGGVAQGVGPEYKPQDHKKEKKIFPLSVSFYFSFRKLII
jgi:hypothetical protein